MRCTEDAVSAASTGELKGPNSSRPQCLSTHHTTYASEVERIWILLPHRLYSPDLSPTDYHFFKHLNNFLQGKCFHIQREAETAFQEFTESQGTDLCYRNKQTYFSLTKNVLVVMVPILINKDVFEPSYNDLKFMV